MDGFTFYTLDDKTKLHPNHREFARQDGLFLHELRRFVSSSGAGLSRLLQHRKTADLIFISAFRTGNIPDVPGSGFYNDGEVDSLGKVHRVVEGKDRDQVSHNENQRRNKKLAEDIHNLGYGFIQVEGNYGASEESFCVVNSVEDSKEFIENLHHLANKYYQDSILVVLKDNGDVYSLHYNGSTKPFEKDLVIEDAVEYFTRIKNHQFKFNLVSGFPGGDSLTPKRQGYGVLVPVHYRRKVFQERQQLKDERAADHLSKMLRW